MATFSVNDFLVIVEAADNPEKWTKKSEGLGWVYSFSVDKIKTKIKASVVDYESAGWMLIIETKASILNAPDSFFATIGDIIQDFVKTDKPGPTQIVFFGEQNLSVSQIALLKRKITETNYKFKINRVPNAFSISIYKD